MCARPRRQRCGKLRCAKRSADVIEGLGAALTSLGASTWSTASLTERSDCSLPSYTTRLPR
eukprot:5001399-Prymnesium_polylepis.1